MALGPLLLACQSPVTIATPNAGIYQEKVPGAYVVMIQTGAWHTEVENGGFTCGAWSFPTDFNSAYEASAKAAFTGAFEQVQFTPVELKPADLAAKGYDAQIIVYQGSLDASYGIREELFSAKLIAAVEMDGIVAIVAPEGLVGQDSPGGSSRHEKGIFMCTEGTEIVARAGGEAVASFVKNAVRAARDKVLEWRARTPPLASGSS